MGAGARWQQVIRANTPHELAPLNGLNGSSPYVGVVGYTVGGGTDRWDGTILTRRWIDPTNRNSDWAQVPLRPGRFYRIDFDMQPKDSVVPAGSRLALMVFSSDRDFTIRPGAGTRLALDLARSSLAPGS
jgi:X-Pro dipeptidyl-peptidase C-terminal non-catalytic domain